MPAARSRLLREHLNLLLKGPEAEDHTLYASHTLWVNRAAFEALLLLLPCYPRLEVAGVATPCLALPHDVPCFPHRAAGHLGPFRSRYEPPMFQKNRYGPFCKRRLFGPFVTQPSQQNVRKSNFRTCCGCHQRPLLLEPPDWRHTSHPRL
jgi:hypothetical protein